MKSWHISSAFWITLLFLFASCDTGGAETLSTAQENRVNLRIHEYLDGDTSLVGTFSLAGDKAFDISQTKQKFYPTSSSIRALGMEDTKAHTSVPSGALFYVNPINRSLSINHITSSLPGKSTSKNDMIATDTMDGIAFYFFLLERPDVILQDSIMVTYNLHI
jgi:hypothetical protein